MTSQYNNAMFTLACSTPTWVTMDEIFAWPVPADIRTRMKGLAKVPRVDRLSEGCDALVALLRVVPLTVHLNIWLMCNARVKEPLKHDYPHGVLAVYSIGDRIHVEMERGGYELRCKLKDRTEKTRVDITAASMKELEVEITEGAMKKPKKAARRSP